MSYFIKPALSGFFKKFAACQKVWAQPAKAAFFASLFALHPLSAVESTARSIDQGEQKGEQKIEVRNALVTALGNVDPEELKDIEGFIAKIVPEEDITLKGAQLFPIGIIKF